MRDPAIKLFGKTIPLMENGPCCSSGLHPDPLTEPAAEDAQLGLQDICMEMTSDEAKDTEMEAPRENHQEKQNRLSSLSKVNETEPGTSSQDGVVENVDSKSQQDQSQADSSGQEKLLKKPDKILPCPRCKSLDTKFCYFNNYNVNQPRHFCKNCQRYWTAGGTMRNVPVGAGRRKNKQSSSHYRHIMLSPEELAAAAARGEATESISYQAQGGHVATKPLKENGAVLKFGSEVPLCESMSSVLNLGDKKKPESSAEEPSCASASNCSVETNGLPENVAPKEPNGMHGYCNGPNPFHPMMQCYPGPPWAYPWNPGWSHVAVAAAAVMAAGCSSSEHVNGSDKGNVGPMQWIPPPVFASPSFCTPPIPIPFVPPAFWPQGACTIPWSGPNSGLSPSTSTSNSECSDNGSPTLGKHYREAYLHSEEKTEKSLWVPKTLRIDDPDEAAKSSIWATLGIEPDQCGIFKPFQSKVERKGQISDAPEALHANPAALSRSQSFQEGT